MTTCICSGILFADVACHPISRIPKAGELLKTEKIELNLGGCAANVAFDLVRLGVPVTLAGKVGDDALSDFIVRSVSESGLNSDYIERSLGHCPGTAIHINVRNEDRRFICTTGANDDFVFDEKLVRLITAKPQIAERKILYLGGFFMLQKLENEQTAQLLRQAQEAGWIVVLDVVLYGERPYWEILKPVLPYVDFILPNEHEG
ncbi:MAG: carbohydrate kinase family protein, partial [Planctomycetaceae bacterium]|nr:carbohydrate kinase family protein [Planctomycetaceae bacterium]